VRPVRSGRPRVRAAVADPQSTTVYDGLGWDGSGGTVGTVPIPSFVEPLPHLWNTTPCVGWSVTGCARGGACAVHRWILAAA